MDVAELIARESIRDLVARYNSNGDSGRFDQVLDLFAPDAVMELDGPEGRELYRGRDEILTIFTGTKDRWAGESSATDGSPSYVRHRVATHQIDLDDPSHARGYCYYQVVMAHGLDHWGRYFDRYECVAGRWLFAHRRVTREGQTPRD